MPEVNRLRAENQKLREALRCETLTTEDILETPTGMIAEHGRCCKRIEELTRAIEGLLRCPDIADSSFKDEETQATERTAMEAIGWDKSGTHVSEDWK